MDSRVLFVSSKDGIIHHITDSQLRAGDEVLCKIDFDDRYEKMQSHSGEHILSGIIHSLYGLDNVGFHLGGDGVTMDISAPLCREELDKVELLANEVIYKNVEITSEFPSKEQLKNMEYRSKLDLSENVRIVRIGEYDVCACCAPHVKRTGEIGLIKILDFAKLRGGIRIHIAAGRRAMRIFGEFYKSVESISAKLSVPKNQVFSGVEKLVCDFDSEREKYKNYRMSVIEKEAKDFYPASDNSVLCFEGASAEELISFSNIALPKVRGILVLLSESEKDCKYVISSNAVDLKSKASEINKSLLGRGGGKPNMIQGSFSSGIDEIKKYFENCALI